MFNLVKFNSSIPLSFSTFNKKKVYEKVKSIFNELLKRDIGYSPIN